MLCLELDALIIDRYINKIFKIVIEESEKQAIVSTVFISIFCDLKFVLPPSGRQWNQKIWHFFFKVDLDVIVLARILF